ncbi:MAG: NADH-quinone oxidoreductase subunit N [Limisphaerales bacterium]
MNYLELARLSLAEAMVVVTALVVLGVDLKLGPASALGMRRAWACGLGIAGCVAAGLWLVLGAPEGSVPGGMLVSDALARWVKCVLLALTVGTLLLSGRAVFSVHVGEYVAVLLLGLAGMLLLAGTENLLVMFLALELASVALYILVGFNKGDARGTEAALKYFLFGGMAGAFLLFGSSLVYGATGAIEFRAVAAKLGEAGLTPLLAVGLVMVLVGMGFKVAAVPFHFWAPDAYQGAPTPAASFVAAGSKVAAFFVLAKLTVVALPAVHGRWIGGDVEPGWVPLLAVVAAASMLIGNLAALAQRNVKRLLAYSAVAHAGYVLMALVEGGPAGFSAVTFYAVTYAVTVLGAFGVVSLVEEGAGGSDWEHFRGLGQRAPGLALCLGIFVLSLAGIPPLAGFFGKFYLFLVAMTVGGGNHGLLWLVALGAATTCLSFYYYLRLLKVVFVEAPWGPGKPWRTRGLDAATVWVAAAAVVGMGVAPAGVLGPLQAALAAAGF